MLKNYFQIAWRNISNSWLYSAINVIGLGSAISVCLLVFIYVNAENSFDKFHFNGKNIYLIYAEDDVFGTDYNNTTPQPLAGALLSSLPEIENVSRYIQGSEGILSVEKSAFKANLTYVDSGFFKMFSFKNSQVESGTVFKGKTDAFLTLSASIRYFGTTESVGKVFQFKSNIEGNDSLLSYRVAGVIQAPPWNSNLKFEILTSQAAVDEHDDRWSSGSAPTFVQLQGGTNSLSMGEKIDAIVAGNSGMGNKNSVRHYHLANLLDLHLNDQIKWPGWSNLTYSYILICLASLILLIVIVNYILIALSIASGRAKEVAVRKVAGATRRQVAIQFLTEAIVMAFISLFVAGAMTVLVLPYFSKFTNLGLLIDRSVIISSLLPLAVFGLLTGLIAGCYPAFYLSRQNPALMLKGKQIFGIRHFLVKPFIILQFFLSAFLVLSAIEMYRQMVFVSNKDLGFQPKDLIVVPTMIRGEYANQIRDMFKKRVSSSRFINDVTGVNFSFGQDGAVSGARRVDFDGRRSLALTGSVDYSTIPTLGLQLEEGRNFEIDRPSDADAVIVNKTFIERYGRPKIGEPVRVLASTDRPTGPVLIGIVKDYNTNTLESKIEPVLLTLQGRSSSTLIFKIDPANVPQALNEIKSLFNEILPDKPFEYAFAEDQLKANYSSYTRWTDIITMLAGYAVLLACSGLFGLASIETVKRSKEIAVRKILGADFISIFITLNKPYVILISTAFLCAFPATNYFINKWLLSFSYKVEYDVWLFVLILVGSFLLTLITIGYHTMTVVLSKPTNVLKYE